MTTKVDRKPFPAKELESWFRSEVKQLTETVHQLQREFESIGKPPAAKRPSTRRAAPVVAQRSTAKRAARPRAAAPHKR